jgi:glycerophosphoryl diester phosphodiesterase
MLKVGHRGARGYEPENTLRSFKTAMDLGADMIEFDVRTCRSGEVVVIHDECVDRTTDGKGKVADMTLAELKRLDAGKGERIPTLEEVLDLAQDRLKVDVELKGQTSAAAVADILNKYVTAGRLICSELLVTSFEHGTLLAQFREASPRVPTGLLFSEVPDNFALKAAEMGAQWVALYYKFTTREIVQEARGRGLKILIWTVNGPEEIKLAGELGVDAIASDFPDRLIGLQDSRSEIEPPQSRISNRRFRIRRRLKARV